MGERAIQPKVLLCNICYVVWYCILN